MGKVGKTIHENFFIGIMRVTAIVKKSLTLPPMGGGIHP